MSWTGSLHGLNMRLNSTNKRILAVASGGGHWTQLLRLRPAFDEFDVTFVTTIHGLGDDIVGADVRIVRDSSGDDRLSLLVTLWQMLKIVRDVRPSIVITTGAAPGLIALCLGKVFGAQTVWIDSIANAERLSLSGKIAGWFADLWLTQWPHLAKSGGPLFKGAVL